MPSGSAINVESQTLFLPFQTMNNPFLATPGLIVLYLTTFQNIDLTFRPNPKMLQPVNAPRKPSEKGNILKWILIIPIVLRVFKVKAIQSNKPDIVFLVETKLDENYISNILISSL